MTENPAEKAQVEQNYRAVFEACGVNESELVVFWGTPHEEVDFIRLVSEKPTGIFVGGGSTPRYHNMLCKDLSWLDYVIENQIPYAGFSAGATIAAEHAVLGGWKVSLNGREFEIMDEELSEGLDALEVKPGLGLVPFSVEAHASQWGTVTRLMHAVDLEMIDEGWAIDENTSLQIENGLIEVKGLGQAYHLQRQSDDTISTKIFHAEMAN